MDMEEYAARLLSECDYHKDLHNKSIYLLDLAAKDAKQLRQRLALYASHIDQLMEGDTHHLERMYTDLRADGFVDEEGFFIYEEDEEDG